MVTFDADQLETRIAKLEDAMGEPDFWSDQKEAARISSEHSRLSRQLNRYERLASDAEDLFGLLVLVSDDDQEIDEVERAAIDLKKELDRLQEDSLFTGTYDAGDSVVSIHAGTGGTDAQDWAEIVLRMYLRWGS